MSKKNSVTDEYSVKLLLIMSILLSTLFFLTSCGDNSDSGAPYTPTITLKPSLSSSWMSKIDGTKLLSEINIPGTHESGTMHNSCPLDEGKCQDMMPIDQLNAGARILDLRLHYHHAWPGEDAFMIRHGSCHCYTGSGHSEELNFDHVLANCIEFLTTNPTETVILLLKQNSSSNETTAFTKLMEGSRYLDLDKDNKINNDNYKDKIYVGDTIPMLDDVRGKIVWVRRYGIYDSIVQADKQQQGIDLTNWDEQNSYFEYGVVGGITVKIQDAYNYLTNNWEKKLNQIKVAADDSTKNHEYLVLNLTSAVGGPTTIQPSPISMANKINPYLTESFFTKGENYDWIIMDFIISDLAKNVYKSNSDFK